MDNLNSLVFVDSFLALSMNSVPQINAYERQTSFYSQFYSPNDMGHTIAIRGGDRGGMISINYFKIGTFQ
jgi:hypothetical protein